MILSNLNHKHTVEIFYTGSFVTPQFWSNKLYAVHKVCTILAEAWFLFRRTNYSSTKLERLGYCPDKSILQKFWKLCEQQLNISGDSTFLLVLLEVWYYNWDNYDRGTAPSRLVDYQPFLHILLGLFIHTIHSNRFTNH